MRWDVKLMPPSITMGKHPLSASPEELEQYPSQIIWTEDECGRKAEVWIAAGEGSIELSVIAECGTPASKKKHKNPEWFNRSYITVFFDPFHDHFTRRAYSINDEGSVISDAYQSVPGVEMEHEWNYKLEEPPPVEGSFYIMGNKGFFARILIQAEDFWKNGSPVAGMRLRIGTEEEGIIPPPFAWPEEDPYLIPIDVPYVFGDIYRETPFLQLEKLFCKEPAWDDENTFIDLLFKRSENAPDKGRVRLEFDLHEESTEKHIEHDWESKEGSFELSLPVRFPHRAKWSSRVENIARLYITMISKDETILWQGEYPFGFDGGIIIRERFGPQSNPLHEKPSPSDTDFVSKFRRYILTRIPNYRLRSTNDGAPSDFFLEDPDGEASLNLSAPDILDNIVDFIVSRFPDWQDALCAIPMWVYHPIISSHSKKWSYVSKISTLETIIRLGGNFCGNLCRLCSGLAERIGERLNVPIKGYSLGVRGHLATLLDTPIGQVVIDGMLGHWYHTLDNTRLATLEEMRMQKEVVDRMWCCPRTHGHEFYYGIHNQIVEPWQYGTLVWPEWQKD